MKIKQKIFLTLGGMSLLIALVSAIAIYHQRLTVKTAAVKEAETVANLLGSIMVTDSGQSHTSIQEIVDRLHQKEQRDIVLMDVHQHVLADAVPEEVGSTFDDDKNDEVGQTIRDGEVRTFIETSEAYPHGIKQIVVAIKSRSGNSIGAVVLEYTPLYEELTTSTMAFTRNLILAGLASVVVAALIAFYMGRSIALPLAQLTKVARAFAAGDTSLPMPEPRNDEIGELANAFADMMQKREAAKAALLEAQHTLEIRVKDRTRELESTHKQLIETSRKAGMAEVATGILHNVGNVLNSVNITSSCVAENLKKSKAPNLAKVVALFQQHEADLGDFLTKDPKGKQIPAYLAKLAEHLSSEQSLALEELAGLQNNVSHIKDIITMQQSHAKMSGATETLPIVDLVEDALKMNASALLRHDIIIVKEFADVPPITVERHKVLQILVNLITNAKQGCDALKPQEKRLTLKVTRHNGFVRVTVADNGIGIPQENLTRIFSHGFTTKKNGHGFGLHSGALAAKEMGGALNVESDGTGKGATFFLDLPYTIEG